MSQMPAFVTFAVGGQRFTTSKDTLLNEPASRLALLVRGVIPAIKDDTGGTRAAAAAACKQQLLQQQSDLCTSRQEPDPVAALSLLPQLSSSTATASTSSWC